MGSMDNSPNKNSTIRGTVYSRGGSVDADSEYMRICFIVKLMKITNEKELQKKGANMAQLLWEH